MATQSKVRSAVALVLAGVVTLPAWAADAPPDGSGALEEITVTARKRTESLQETPISISAFSADRLESQGITSIMRIQDITPNLVFQNTPSNSGLASNAAVYIRGIGQKDFAPTTDPGVGLYVDGAYLGRTAGAVFDLVDIEQVEVLRGPQGTLFGRNTIGGAISITTKKPENAFNARADVKFGTDSRINVRASVNVPFTDTFYGKLTAASFKQDGYVTRPFDGKDLGNQDYKTGRIALRWVPSDALEFNFAADYAKDESNGPAVVITRVDRPSDTPGSFVTLNNAFAFFDPATGPGDPNQCFTSANFSNPLCYNDRVVAGKNTNLGSGPNFSELTTKSASLTAEWRLPLLTVKSITAWRKVDGAFAQDRDGGAQPVGGLFQAPINHVFDTFEQKQVSQEFQFLGTALDERINWVAGLYWFKEEGENLNPVDFRPVAIQSGGFFDYKSYAAFAQFTWKVTDALSVTPGARYTKDERDYLPDQFFESLPLGPLGFPCFVPSFHIPCVVGDRVVPFETVSADASKTTPYLNVAYQWHPGFMTYATYSEGFRSGGYTQRIFPPEASLPSFKPENVKSYELGFKYTTPGESMRLNGAVFYTDYKDLQLLVSDASRIGPYITNAGKAEIQGFELEWAFSPGAGWRLDASVGYTDPKYKEIDARVNPADLNTDSDFVLVSDWNTSVSVEKLFTLGASGTLRPRVDWSWRSKFATNANGVPQPSTLPRDFLYQPAYSVVNASVNWLSDDERYSVTLGVDNLADEEYRVFGDYQPGFGFAMEAFDRGRQWYVKAGVSF
jgi:iron complex outermembrane receptor protein